MINAEHQYVEASTWKVKICFLCRHPDWLIALELTQTSMKLEDSEGKVLNLAIEIGKRTQKMLLLLLLLLLDNGSTVLVPRTSQSCSCTNSTDGSLRAAAWDDLCRCHYSWKRTKTALFLTGSCCTSGSKDLSLLHTAFFCTSGLILQLLHLEFCHTLWLLLQILVFYSST